MKPLDDLGEFPITIIRTVFTFPVFLVRAAADVAAYKVIYVVPGQSAQVADAPLLELAGRRGQMNKC